MSKTAGIVVIGNEILSGRTQDENAAYLLRQLRDLGVDVRKVSVIPDELSTIRDEVRSVAGMVDYVFTSGGVGPTHDDVTIAGIAAAFDRPIYRNEELLTVLQGYYQENLSDAMLRMALIPEGAVLVRSDSMRFPVVVVENVYIFPGVPEILSSKFERIKEMFREPPFQLVDVFLKAEEGVVAPILDEIVGRFPDLRLGSYPTLNNSRYTLKLTLESKNGDYLRAAHRFLVAKLEESSLYPL